MDTHVSLLNPPPTPLGRHRALSWPSVLCSNFPLTSYFSQGSVYISMLLAQFIQASPSPLCPQVHSLHLCLYSCPIIGSLYFFIWLHSNPGKQVSWSTSFSVEAEAQSGADNAQLTDKRGTWGNLVTWLDMAYYSTLNCWWGDASPKKGDIVHFNWYCCSLFCRAVVTWQLELWKS